MAEEKSSPELRLRVAQLEARMRWLEAQMTDLSRRHAKQTMDLLGAEYLSASQLTSLPGLPHTRPGVRDWMRRHGVKGRRRISGRGGGFEYPVRAIKKILLVSSARRDTGSSSSSPSR